MEAELNFFIIIIIGFFYDFMIFDVFLLVLTHILIFNILCHTFLQFN